MLQRFLQFHSATRIVAIIFLIIGVVIVVYGYGLTQATFDWKKLVEALYANLGMEFVSIAVTVLVVDRLNQRQSLVERRQDLMLQMGSPEHAFAIEAVRLLRQKGWLTDGSLKGIDLTRANLAGADLSYANLVGAKLVEANLQKASLRGANLEDAALGFALLQQANLRDAVLRHTRLGGANLEGADLSHTNLSQAESWGANLRGVKLAGANLHEVRLRGATLNEQTILPCGNQWHAKTDMKKYTLTEHPEYVQYGG